MKLYEQYLHENETQAVTLFAQRVKEFLKDNMLEMKLFGSKVRGDFDEDSDIDILLIVKYRDARLGDQISEIAADLNLEYDCVLSPIIYTEREFKKNQTFHTLFTETLAREGVML